MPYITRQRREAFLGFDKQAYAVRIDTSGELNHFFTLGAKIFLAQHGESYETMNKIVGALECAKEEFVRRKLIPYEEKKMVENGDVYEAMKAEET